MTRMRDLVGMAHEFPERKPEEEIKKETEKPTKILDDGRLSVSEILGDAGETVPLGVESPYLSVVINAGYFGGTFGVIYHPRVTECVQLRNPENGILLPGIRYDEQEQCFQKRKGAVARFSHGGVGWGAKSSGESIPIQNGWMAGTQDSWETLPPIGDGTPHTLAELENGLEGWMWDFRTGQARKA